MSLSAHIQLAGRWRVLGREGDCNRKKLKRLGFSESDSGVCGFGACIDHHTSPNLDCVISLCPVRAGLVRERSAQCQRQATYRSTTDSHRVSYPPSPLSSRAFCQNRGSGCRYHLALHALSSGSYALATSSILPLAGAKRESFKRLRPVPSACRIAFPNAGPHADEHMIDSEDVYQRIEFDLREVPGAS